MAEFVTHGLIGAASCPTEPVAGCIVGNVCDGAQVLAAAYLSFKNRRLTLSVWPQWDEQVPGWIKGLNRQLHSVWYPVFALFACWWLGWHDAIQFVLAWLSHPVIDVFTHDRIAVLHPFSNYLLEVGKTYHSIENMRQGTWFVVLVMITSAFIIGVIAGTWPL